MKVFENKHRALSYFISLFVLQIATCHLGHSQISSVDNQIWRRVPSHPAEEGSDTSSQQISKARSELFDNIIGNATPLDQQGEEDKTTGLIRERQSHVEMPISSSSTIIAATFEEDKVHLTSSKKSIYTELRFRVKALFKDSDTNLHVGDLISILKPGGTIILPDGHARSYALRDDSDLFSPGHKYILFLNYDKATASYWVVESWITIKGTVYANSLEDIERDRNGHLEHSQQTEAQFAGDLNRRLHSDDTGQDEVTPDPLRTLYGDGRNFP